MLKKKFTFKILFKEKDARLGIINTQHGKIHKCYPNKGFKRVQ